MLQGCNNNNCYTGGDSNHNSYCSGDGDRDNISTAAAVAAATIEQTRGKGGRQAESNRAEPREKKRREESPSCVPSNTTFERKREMKPQSWACKRAIIISSSKICLQASCVGSETIFKQ